MEIFLDMDDVLVEFNKPAHALLNIPSVPWPWPVGQWELPCYDKEFWEGLTTEWWGHREWTPFGRDLIDMCVAYAGIENIWIATFFNKTCCGSDIVGKIEWINHNIPELLPRTLFCGNKSVLGKRNAVLIDDYIKNIESFRLGYGYGILCPAPHNHMYRSDPVKHIRRSLIQLIKKGFIC